MSRGIPPIPCYFIAPNIRIWCHPDGDYWFCALPGTAPSLERRNEETRQTALVKRLEIPCRIDIDGDIDVPNRDVQAKRHEIWVNMDEIHLPQSVFSLLPDGHQCIQLTSSQVSVSQPSASHPSRIECLPLAVMVRIIDNVACKSALICLALTSRVMAMQVSLFLPKHFSKCPGDWEAYLNLMARLESWMPPHFLFCHHCLRYRRAIEFDSDENREHPRLCFSCERAITYKEPDIGCSCGSEWECRNHCDGCEIFECAKDDWEEDSLKHEMCGLVAEGRGPYYSFECCD